MLSAKALLGTGPTEGVSFALEADIKPSVCALGADIMRIKARLMLRKCRFQSLLTQICSECSIVKPVIVPALEHAPSTPEERSGFRLRPREA